MYVYICIYYTERERERPYVDVCVYIYIYMYEGGARPGGLAEPLPEARVEGHALVEEAAVTPDHLLYCHITVVLHVHIIISLYHYIIVCLYHMTCFCALSITWSYDFAVEEAAAPPDHLICVFPYV